MNTPKRLSESGLWNALRNFYEEKGVDAWASDDLPFFATNNPALARTYSDLFASFIDDCLFHHQLDLEQPLYIAELGGGMGRLAYLMLVRLQEMSPRLPLRVKYLLTDYVQGNVDFYNQHPRFAPFFENGMLETRQYDAENDTLDLPTGNPVFCIANYLFDSLSQDGFKVEDGELSEVLCHRDDDEKLVFTTRPLSGPAYGVQEYDSVLQAYSQELGNTHFPFPVGPLKCLSKLGESSGNRFILAMSDKALRTTEDLHDFKQLPTQKHNEGFSMSVNCDALDRIWENLGGRVVHSAPRAVPLHIALYQRGFSDTPLGRMEQVFRDQVDGFGPLDYLDLRAQSSDVSVQNPLKFYLNLLRLSRWDPEFFYELSNTIGEAALSASMDEQRELYEVMTRCWGNYFPIPDERDVPFAVARVLACINQFQQAVGFYGESVRLYGDRALTHHNIGICQFNLSLLEEAEQSFQRALEIEPDYGPSKELLVRTRAEQKRRGALSV